MILTTHALTGAVIGKNIDSIPLVILLSLVIHFAMDHLRHGEYVESFNSKTGLKNSSWKILLDLSSGGLVIFCFIFFAKSDFLTIRNIFLGIFFSMFPDLLTVIYWAFRWPFLKKVYEFHSFMHRFPRFAPERQWTFRNARNDMIISAIAILLLFFG